MSLTKQKIDQLLELANLYPSPHNGQPIRIKLVNDQNFDIYFVKNRGLQAVDISYIFSFVTMGIFVEHFQSSAKSLGHELNYKLYLPTENELHGVGIVKFATVNITWDTIKPNENMQNTIHFRQTSRKKYSSGLDATTCDAVIKIATNAKMELQQLNRQQAHQTIWLNQRAVFDDMFDEPVRQELDHWLRYNQAEKKAKMDGLAYDCMELSGPVMKYLVHHPKILRWPAISNLLKQYYLRTMTDSSDIFYMLAPFATGQEAFNIGVTIMKIWFKISAKGYYLHPFGTIMSNHAAHQDFIKLAGIQNESREKSYLVFIFRSGKSETPVRSLRLPYQQHLRLDSVDV